MTIWQGLAFTVLIFLAGLQNIPNQLYEAASIDGAVTFTATMHGPTYAGTDGLLGIVTDGYVTHSASLIKGDLPRGELGVLFGASGSGKTFVALDLAFSVARGIAWRDRRTTRGRWGKPAVYPVYINRGRYPVWKSLAEYLHVAPGVIISPVVISIFKGVWMVSNLTMSDTR
jgi:hypothetical protein